MNMGPNTFDSATLHGLVAESVGDIVIRCDADGFIQQSSPNIEELGFNRSPSFLAPHIVDIAQTDYQPILKDYFEAALNSSEIDQPVEFPVNAVSNDASSSLEQARSIWHTLSIRPLENAEGKIIGALALLRSVEHLRVLEDELHTSSTVDPLTGITNGKATRCLMQRMLNERSGATMAVFEVDHFRAITMQYGQQAAEEVLWAVAQFLKAMIRPGIEIGYMGGERFAVLFSNIDSAEACAWCAEVIETFTTLAASSDPRGPKLSASAGVAPIAASVDQTLKQAELGLIMARAHGGKRVAASHFEGGPYLYGARSFGVPLGARAAA